MNYLIRHLTSTNGLIAALAVILTMAVAVMTLIRPYLGRRRAQQDSRRAQQDSKAHLVLSQLWLSELSRSSRSRELRFHISNSGEDVAVLASMRLVVLENQPSSSNRTTVTEAPLAVHQHRVELRPDKQEYEVRSRIFSPELPPLSYAQGEVEGFIVKLVAREPQVYQLQLVIRWFGATTPSEERVSVSEPITADFPPDERDAILHRS